MARRKDINGGHVAYSITLPKPQSDFVMRLVEQEERQRSWVIAKIIQLFMASGSGLDAHSDNVTGQDTGEAAT